jgi:Ca2+/H+ antiporter, TMEM165/GDT1 family
MRRNWLFIVPAALIGIALFVFVGGEVVRLLWNWLLPPLFGLREITFWQALGLLALSRILVGGFGMRGGSHSRSAMRSRMADRMADRVADRWDRMSPEERDRFRQRLRERCGFDPLAGESQRTSTP